MIVLWGLISIVSGLLLFVRRPLINTIPTQSRKVSVIIPARNEAHNLTKLLSSFDLSDVYECIVVDDGSTDDTARIAKSLGAIVISFDNQSDWKGKSAACYRGAEAANGDILLFLDADTHFHDTKAIQRITTAYKGGLMSIQPYHEMKQWYEQGSLYFNILTVLGLNATSIFKGEDGVFGPCVICRKQDYITTDGHRAAAGQLIEGFGLGTVFKAHQFKLYNHIGKNIIHFRMYPDGIHAMTRGWMKHFAAGSAATDKRVLALIILWMSGAFIPLLVVICPEKWLIIIILYLMYTIILYWISSMLGNFKLLTIMCYPLVLAYFVFVFTKSIVAIYIKKEVKWKGRNINL
ncbi:glycosyltransferase [Macrococcus equi]|uniref:glycosyltransferase n=1 Tax=Macrococcus equi TaxID=3395462 RepID=UPI0039BDFD67